MLGIRRRTAQKVTVVTSWGIRRTTARMIKEVLLIHVRSVFQRCHIKRQGKLSPDSFTTVSLALRLRSRNIICDIKNLLQGQFGKGAANFVSLNPRQPNIFTKPQASRLPTLSTLGPPSLYLRLSKLLLKDFKASDCLSFYFKILRLCKLLYMSIELGHNLLAFLIFCT
jgi:hypothetical protein